MEMIIALSFVAFLCSSFAFIMYKEMQRVKAEHSNKSN